MKTWKLVSGILSITFSLLVFLQSCAAGVVNSLEKNGEMSGFAGFLTGIFLISGGIISIVTRKSEKGGNIALIIIFTLASLIGFTMAGNFSDLKIWASWCLLNVILAIMDMLKKKNIFEE